MKTYQKLFLGGVLAMTFVSCGWGKKEKDNDGSLIEAAKNTAKEHSIMGSWDSGCRGSDLLEAHKKDKYSFEGDVFTLTTEFFAGSEKCEGTPSIVQSYEGTFKLLDVNEDTEKARNIDFEYKNSYLMANTDGGVKLLNSLKFCGVSDWKKADKKKLNDLGGSVGCPIHRVPQKRFDVVKIENDELFFGYTTLIGLSKSRPAALDHETIYRKN